MDTCAYYGECAQQPYVLVDGHCNGLELEARSAWIGSMFGSVGALLVVVVILRALSWRK